MRDYLDTLSNSKVTSVCFFGLALRVSATFRDTNSRLGSFPLDLDLWLQSAYVDFVIVTLFVKGRTSSLKMDVGGERGLCSTEEVSKGSKHLRGILGSIQTAWELMCKLQLMC
jgi:hypothetical protein